MSPKEMRDALIKRTITVIAAEGLNGATTKAIVTGTGINEAYIYRIFSDKEDLLAKTFGSLDEELVLKAMQHIPVMYMDEIDYETRCRFFFSAIWEFLLGNKEKCLAFIRYYYSPYFQKYSSEEHINRYKPLVEKFNDAFREEANVWMILNHILNVMLDFAVKVHNNETTNNQDYAEHVFRVIYRSVAQYFREPHWVEA